MNNLVSFTPRTDMASSKLGSYINRGSISENIVSALPVLSIRGGRFRIKYKGQEQLLLEATPSGQHVARTNLDVVILDVSPNFTKTYYEKDYIEGSSATPTCFSNDGERPDPSIENPQSDQCASCYQNSFGSARTGTGKGKACSDSKKLAVVSINDLAATQMGNTPALLRVPVMSLASLQAYDAALLATLGPSIGWNAVVTRIKMDPQSTYSRLIFEGVRQLEPAEEVIITQHYKSGAVKRVMDSTSTTVAQPEPEPEPEPVEPVEPVQPVQPESETDAESPDADVLSGFSATPPAAAEPPPPKARRGRKKGTTKATPPKVVESTEFDSDVMEGVVESAPTNGQMFS